MIDSAFTNIKLFVPSFRNSDNDPTRDSFGEYYMPLVKECYALIKNKSYFNQLIKIKQEVFKKLVQMSGNSDYTTRDLLDNIRL